MGFVATIIGTLIGAVFSGLIIYIIGKMGWGIEVDGYRPAYLAAIIIAVLSIITHYFWNLVGFEAPIGLPGAIINAVITAIFLQFAGDRLDGLRVKGFSGALIAALIIGAVAYGIGLLTSSVV